MDIQKFKRLNRTVFAEVFVCMIIFSYFSYIFTNLTKHYKERHDNTNGTSNVKPFYDRDRYKNKICLLTRVKNVAYLLPQWLEYHIASGVDHFYIVNDCSDDNGNVRYSVSYLCIAVKYHFCNVDCLLGKIL